MDTVFEFTKKLALKTGEVLLDYYRSDGVPQDIKEDHTVVTDADLAADKLIRTTIQKHYPEDGILSEEGNTTFLEDQPYVWIIDPLDGTTNFSLGLHYWGVVITRLKRGSPDLAAIYFPYLDELFSAVKGGGAWLNGAKLQVRPGEVSRTETFFSCCSRTHRTYQVDIPYKTRILGSAAYGLCTIARGSAILALEVTPKIWDFAGSWLITQEAGGMIAALDGDQIFPLRSGIDYQGKSYPILVAPDQDRWNFGRQRIK
jgi:myo-inositol-1(or 4)-monophosphatase